VVRAHPPKPRLTLDVGVVGHRPDNLSATALPHLEASIKRVLDVLAEEVQATQADLAEWFTPEPPVVALVSSLAEGIDRIAARLARARQMPLDVPLPFAQAEYEADFPTEESVEEFRALLREARSLSTLAGSRQTEYAASLAYEAAGHTVLSQADIVLAVWDGAPGRGRGGTADLIATAARLGIPIILIGADGSKPPELIWRGLSEHPVAAEHLQDLPRMNFEPSVGKVLRTLLSPPRDHGEHESLQAYTRERYRRFVHRPEWNFLTGLFGLRPPRGMTWSFRPSEAARHFAGLVPHVDAGKLVEAFGWADALAVRYAHMFRGAFIFNFFFAFLAVLCAAVAISVPSHHTAFAFGEVFFVLCVIVNTLWGWRRRWHSRWFEAREVAERLRVALPLWLLGIGPTTLTGKEVTWTGWYVRSLLREQPLCSGSLAGSGFRAARNALMAIVVHQAEYHRGSCRQMHALNSRLEVTGMFLLAFSLIAAMYALLVPSSHAPADATQWVLASISIIFPVCASAIYGIRLIGDFEGIAHRSGRALKALEEIQQAITQDPDDLTLLRGRAKAAADAMLGDVTAWRMAAEGRGLAIPG
jgi:hypothetical protein